MRRAILAVDAEISLDRVVIHIERPGESPRIRYGRASRGVPSVVNTNGLDYWEWCSGYLIIVVVHDRPDAPDWVHILAHEAKHIDQYRQDNPRARERAANAFADYFVRECWSGA